MKALVIAPQPFFSPRGTPFSVYYRTMVEAQLGLKIDLLTYGEGQDADIPGVRIIRIPRFAFLGNVRVGPSALKLFLDKFLFVWTVALLLRNRYDIVHAHEESVFYAWLLKPIFRFKLIYDMHSSLPQQLSNFSFTRSKILIGLFRWLEDSALAKSDAVITICPELAEYAEPRMPDPSRHFLIENSIFDFVRLKSQAHAVPPAPDPAATPPGRAIVIYTGTFEAYQGLELLIGAFARAHALQPGAFLLLVGGNRSQIERLSSLASARGLTGHCHFTGRVPQPLAQWYARKASVQTSPRTTGSNTPLKIYEQLASGVPLVATRIPSHTQVVDDRVCFLVDPTEEALAQGLGTALTDTLRRDQVVAAARELYERRYSRRVYDQKMRSMLESLA